MKVELRQLLVDCFGSCGPLKEFDIYFEWEAFGGY